LSIADTYNEEKIDQALKILEQKPNNKLKCVYCHSDAETWDHIIALVKGGEFSGFGHQIANLVPCCKPCNSKKGNKDWRTFLATTNNPKFSPTELLAMFEKYIRINSSDFHEHLKNPDINIEFEKFATIKQNVLKLLKDADIQAEIIRNMIQLKH
jgi:hypothetical protein